MTETTKTDLTKLCMMLYGVYAGSMIMNFSMATMIAGFIIMLIAIILTYLKVNAAKGTLCESHLQWMIRTFWIGGGVFLPILTAGAAAILFAKMDMSTIYAAMEAGEISDPNQLAYMLLEKNYTLILVTLSIFTIPFALWWLRRCWIGYQLLKEGKPIPNVMSWL